MTRNILKSVICGSLAILVTYITLGPIMQPATLVATWPLADEVAMQVDSAGTASQPS